MTQTTALLRTLKRALKAHGITYAQVGLALNLSEASVKRQFSGQRFTLERLERIAALLGCDFADLIQLMQAEAPVVRHLTAAQEAELVADMRLLLVAICMLNHWRFEDVLATYALDEHEGLRLLVRLDRLGLIELLPGNRVRLKVARDFHWLPDGPIERFFRAQVKDDFFRVRFEGPGELLLFANGMLSRSANAQLQQRLRRVAAEFADLHAADASLPLSERFGTSLLLALRPWELAAFEALRRKPDERQF